MPENVLFSYHSDSSDADLLDPKGSAWRRSDRITLDRDWKGRSFLQEVGLDWAHLTQASSKWNGDGLYFFFACWFLNSPNRSQGDAVDSAPRFWQGDTLKIALRPAYRDDYFDIEVNPRGQCLAAHVRDPRVDVNHFWRSGIQLGTDVSEGERIWRSVVHLPLSSLAGAAAPVPGSAWRLNLFRTVVTGPGQPEWLFWRPTFSPRPDYHRPASFGSLFFLESE